MDKLTFNGITALLAYKPCVLQVISIHVSTLNGKEYIIGVLSDGRASQKNVVFSEAAIKQIGKQPDELPFAIIKIVRCGPLSNKQAAHQRAVKIQEAELVSAMYKTQLGSPIAYDQYLEKNGKTPEFPEDTSKAVRQHPKVQQPAEVKKPVQAATKPPPKGLSQPKLEEESKNNPINVAASKPAPKQQTIPNMIGKSRDNSIGKVAQVEQKKAVAQNPPKQAPKTASIPPFSKVEPLKKDFQKKTEAYEGITDLGDLYMGMEDWVIRVRVLFKSEIKKIKTKKNMDMDIVNFTFVDRKGTSIQATAFNESAERYHTSLQLNFVYDISNAQVQTETRPRAGFNLNIKLTLNEKSMINEADDDGRIPTIEDRCCSLQEYIDKNIGETCSVICMIKQAQQVDEFISRAGKNCKKRVVIICDPVEKVELPITVWGQNVHYDFENVPYVMSDLTVKQYNGVKQYSAGFESAIVPIKDHKFRRFRDLSSIDFVNKGTMSTSKGSRTTFEDMLVKTGLLNGSSEKVWSEVKCFIVSIRTAGTMWYLSCPKCKKKVVEESNSTCQHCNANYDNGKYRFIMSAEFADTTTSIWATIYDELAEKILDGRTADELQKMELEEIKDVCNTIKGKELIGLFMSRDETYEGNTRIKHSLSKLLPFETVRETETLLKEIYDYLNI